MLLYAAVSALLCISFTRGFTIPFNTTTEIPTSSTSTTTTTATTPTTTTTTTPVSNTTTTPVPTTTPVSTTTPVPTTITTSTTTTTPVPTTTTTPVATTATTPVQTTTTTPVATTATTPVPTTTTTPVQETRQATDPPNVIIDESNRKCSWKGMTTDVLEVGCWGYKRCVNGTEVTYWCTDNTVLERDSFTCVRPGKGNTACKKEISCEGVEDGRYADEDTGCQSYYQCVNGKPYPHMYCPATLVFNEEIQNCDYPINVEPPCGTKAVLQ